MRGRHYLFTGWRNGTCLGQVHKCFCLPQPSNSWSQAAWVGCPSSCKGREDEPPGACGRCPSSGFPLLLTTPSIPLLPEASAGQPLREGDQLPTVTVCPGPRASDPQLAAFARNRTAGRVKDGPQFSHTPDFCGLTSVQSFLSDTCFVCVVLLVNTGARSQSHPPARTVSP